MKRDKLQPLQTASKHFVTIKFQDMWEWWTHLSTEAAGVLWMLACFYFFCHLSKRSTISGTIFTNNSNLSGTFRLLPLKKLILQRENLKMELWTDNIALRAVSVRCGYSNHMKMIITQCIFITYSKARSNQNEIIKCFMFDFSEHIVRN